MTEIATQDVARNRAAMIRAGIQNYLHTLSHISAAYAQRDWKALGYDSWEAYVDGEYSEHRLKLSPEHRQKAVAELRLAGMSQRAIGTALGVSQETVRRDLSGDTSESPAEIQGADGKTYASTRPTSTPTGPSVPSASATDDDRSGPNHPAARGEARAGLAADAPTSASEATDGVEAAPSSAGDSPVVSVGDTDTTGDHDPDEFAATLDRLVPDPNPHREWRRRFLDAISGVHKVMRFAPDDVAERADDTCVEELIRVVDAIADYRLRVVNTRIANLPDNVTPIRRAQ